MDAASRIWFSSPTPSRWCLDPYLSIYVCVFEWVWVSVYTWTQLPAFDSLKPRLHTYTHTYTRKHVRTYTHTSTCTHAHMHTLRAVQYWHTQTSTHTHTRTQNSPINIHKSGWPILTYIHTHAHAHIHERAHTQVSGWPILESASQKMTCGYAAFTKGW